MQDHPFGWLSILPPVITIILAVVTKRILTSLFIGIAAGSLLLSKGDPIAATEQFFVVHLWPSATDSDRLAVFAFTMIMGSMVGVVSRSAGMQGLVNSFTPIANTRVKGQFATWIMGLVVFFDDYANSLLLGKTLRPLTDRLRISREKLAYIVDSTAAPISGLALISTWIAGELDAIGNGLTQAGADKQFEPYELFISSIPYRFYVLYALLFIPILIFLKREFGPMHKAELHAVIHGVTDHKTVVVSGDADTMPFDSTPARWYNAVIPIAATVLGVLYFLYSSGQSPDDPGRSLQDIFGNADSYRSLLWGAILGYLVAVVLILPQRIISFGEIERASLSGALKMTPALAILWLASTLSGMTSGESSDAGEAWMLKKNRASIATAIQDGGDLETTIKILHNKGLSNADIVKAVGDSEEPAWMLLTKKGAELEALEAAQKPDAKKPSTEFVNSNYRLYSGDFLTSLLGDKVDRRWFPTIIFLLACAIAYSTGTSWGTMAIVMPIAVPLALGTRIDEASDHMILIQTVGAVLAGAIFGDHCSPISDTTVLSSQASSCDHIQHVVTQMPYAISVALISVFAGTIPVAFGINVWVVLFGGVVAMIGLILLIGKKIPDPE